jgi:hypothetical protein
MSDFFTTNFCLPNEIVPQVSLPQSSTFNRASPPPMAVSRIVPA